jgi:hypothetical protein
MEKFMLCTYSTMKKNSLCEKNSLFYQSVSPSYLLAVLGSCSLGLELRAFTLSHSTSPIFVKGFLR